jgi:hypothetical protein
MPCRVYNGKLLQPSFVCCVFAYDDIAAGLSAEWRFCFFVNADSTRQNKDWQLYITCSEVPLYAYRNLNFPTCSRCCFPRGSSCPLLVRLQKPRSRQHFQGPHQTQSGLIPQRLQRPSIVDSLEKTDRFI